MNPNTKPTMADATALIACVTYTRLPSGTAIVCEITQTNGQNEHGISNVVDIENYNENAGCKAAYGYALAKVFNNVADIFHTKMAKGDIPNNHFQLVKEYQTDDYGPKLIVPTKEKQND